MRYLITVSYDGTLFAGYQKQPKQGEYEVRNNSYGISV